MRVILSRPPTWPNVAEMARAFERSESAIKLIYFIAHLPPTQVSEKMKDTATWMQIRRVAGELGYVRIGKGEMKRFAPRCPDCNSKAVPIVYGYPTPETEERAKRGDLVLGGCMPMEPAWCCLRCEKQW